MILLLYTLYTVDIIDYIYFVSNSESALHPGSRLHLFVVGNSFVY